MEFWDDYEHLDSTIEYVVESVQSEEIELTSSGQVQGCSCVGICNVENYCICLSRSGSHYLFHNINELETYSLKITSNKPSYECNDGCKCRNQSCGHKLVQFGPNKHLKITNFDKDSNRDSKGLGLIATEPIKSNTFICEYAGEVVSESEAKNRFQSYNERGLNRNYIFCINENFGEVNYKTYIDPTVKGNIGRYVNHSCEPNCTLIPIRINDIIPKLCIFTKFDIDPGTEVTFNYGDLNKDESNVENLKKCLCQSSNCKKFLPFDVNV